MFLNCKTHLHVYDSTFCKGLQGDAVQSAANQARNTGANPFS